MKYKVVHLSSAHSRYDMRIFHKMCTSLANHSYKVTLVVADGKGNGVKNGVSIVDAGAKTGGRLSRMTKTVRRVLAKAKELDADVYHLHDPELMPIGVKLKRKGYKVIFDAHEDAPKQMLSKPYLNKFLLWVIARALAIYEIFVCSRLDGTIGATEAITRKFLDCNKMSININNYPFLNELGNDMSWNNKKKQVTYIGGISKIRGNIQVCEAIGDVHSDVRLVMAGNYSEEDLEKQLKNSKGWAKTEMLGFLDRSEVRDLLKNSIAGVVTFLPEPNHIEAQPNKLFEYMSAGVPVIASDFPLWRKIVGIHNCGLLVDPLNPSAIAKAIDKLASDPELAKTLGKNGRKAVEDKYNWEVEERKLIEFYDQILKA